MCGGGYDNARNSKERKTKMKLTIRYQFLTTVIDGGIRQFRAKHVLDWYKMIRPDRRIYPAQPYVYVITPLLEQGIIRKIDVGLYEVDLEMAKSVLHELKYANKKDQREHAEFVAALKKQGLSVTEAMESDGEPDPIDIEWEKHIARKLRGG